VYAHALTDLRGFGFEHAGVAARDMIGRVMSVSMANYPEQMHTCYLVNVPWVFFALWRALTPMMSPRTVDKVSASVCLHVCMCVCTLTCTSVNSEFVVRRAMHVVVYAVSW
jgi:CRAL/TRIO domain